MIEADADNDGLSYAILLDINSYLTENGAQGSWRLLAKCGINEGTPVKDNDGSSNDSGRGSDEGDQRTKLGGNLQTFRDWYPSKSNHVIYKRGKVDVQLERDDVPESNV
ncbi:DgyrCDS2085 [Dimorphilus gyrociliatus]|uniref:DgyrCDS2085 n=1 Tax=Dimorphilus gyrociliatus TaxID=2664684 RepID=A0A7I8VB08_9ANNE|nr:DgyrCDS2085 [Dimorphilus gyrociliatus]